MKNLFQSASCGNPAKFLCKGPERGSDFGETPIKNSGEAKEDPGNKINPEDFDSFNDFKKALIDERSIWDKNQKMIVSDLITTHLSEDGALTNIRWPKIEPNAAAKDGARLPITLNTTKVVQNMLTGLEKEKNQPYFEDAREICDKMKDMLRKINDEKSEEMAFSHTIKINPSENSNLSKIEIEMVPVIYNPEKDIVISILRIEATEKETGKKIFYVIEMGEKDGKQEDSIRAFEKTQQGKDLVINRLDIANALKEILSSTELKGVTQKRAMGLID